MALKYGECTLKFTHTYGLFNGQMDVITFVPVTGPVRAVVATSTR